MREHTLLDVETNFCCRDYQAWVRAELHERASDFLLVSPAADKPSVAFHGAAETLILAASVVRKPRAQSSCGLRTGWININYFKSTPYTFPIEGVAQYFADRVLYALRNLDLNHKNNIINEMSIKISQIVSQAILKFCKSDELLHPLKLQAGLYRVGSAMCRKDIFYTVHHMRNLARLFEPFSSRIRAQTANTPLDRVDAVDPDVLAGSVIQTISRLNENLKSLLEQRSSDLKIIELVERRISCLTDEHTRIRRVDMIDVGSLSWCGTPSEYTTLQ